MELKYTIEILTKDIQDIEKLVGNMQNSQDGSAIELDLALSKLRNVYEILTMIKADRLKEMAFPDQVPPVETREETEDVVASSPEPEPEPDRAVVPESIPEVNKEGEILAEKFSSESSINENLAGKRGGNIDTKVIGKPIDDIGRNIGINDRFLIIRELFGGDTDGFNNLVNNLNEAGTYQDALGILKNQFSESLEHDGVEILSDLIKRKFIRE